MIFAHQRRKDFIDREYKSFPKFDVFTRQLPFFYAKSFIFALDGIGKILTQLAKLSETEDVPAGIVDIKNEFYSHFTNLTALRNSFHHFEDRLQGKAFGNPINLQEVEHELFEKPSKVLMLGNLAGNKYSCTSADGSLPFVEISEENLVKAAECIQKVIDEFNWKDSFIRTFP